MPGETDLNKLIERMTPALRPGAYVFTTVEDIKGIGLDQKDIIGLFKEREGFTLILEKSIADSIALDYDFVAAWITLEVHSSLNAVGLTAAVSKVLAKANISCNVVAGYYHDHIFVPRSEAEKTLALLEHLSKKAR